MQALEFPKIRKLKDIIAKNLYWLGTEHQYPIYTQLALSNALTNADYAIAMRSLSNSIPYVQSAVHYVNSKDLDTLKQLNFSLDDKSNIRFIIVNEYLFIESIKNHDLRSQKMGEYLSKLFVLFYFEPFLNYLGYYNENSTMEFFTSVGGLSRDMNDFHIMLTVFKEMEKFNFSKDILVKIKALKENGKEPSSHEATH